MTKKKSKESKSKLDALRRMTIRSRPKIYSHPKWKKGMTVFTIQGGVGVITQIGDDKVHISTTTVIYSFDGKPYMSCDDAFPSLYTLEEATAMGLYKKTFVTRVAVAHAIVFPPNTGTNIVSFDEEYIERLCQRNPEAQYVVLTGEYEVEE